MTWKYGAIFALGTALWSILALSGTLAGEARRGSLDFVAAAPFGKRRIALEKLAAHLTMLGLAMAILAIAHHGELERRSATPRSATRSRPCPPSGFALWVGFIALFFGGLAFALAPAPRPRRRGRRRRPRHGRAVGRERPQHARADRLARARSTGPPTTSRSSASTTGRASRSCGIVAVVFLAIGVELFSRRDLGVTAGLSLPAPARRRPRRPRADQPGLRRAAAAGARLGHRPRPDGRAPRLARRLDGRPDRRRAPTWSRPSPRSSRTSTSASAGGFLQLYVAALLHRRRLRRRDVRLEVGVGRDRRPARG